MNKQIKISKVTSLIKENNEVLISLINGKLHDNQSLLIIKRVSQSDMKCYSPLDESEITFSGDIEGVLSNYEYVL